MSPAGYFLFGGNKFHLQQAGSLACTHGISPEELVALAFFDLRVTSDTKKLMLSAYSHE